MTLHLVGETLDKARSHKQAEAGNLVKLMRGIYVDAGDDIDAAVLKHAVRIARYLHRHAYLAAASAVLLGPTRDGRLFITGRRGGRTRLRALEIIENAAPPHPSVAPAIVDDGMGEFRIDVSSIRQRFLEAFRVRSEHAGSIDEAMRDDMAARLIAEYGTATLAADALWALARQNDWHREAERAERRLRRAATTMAPLNQAAFGLIVAWHGVPLGNLSHDGFEWRWAASGAWTGPSLIRETVPGKLPPFVVSLLPEGWLDEVLKGERDERARLRSGKRYMSNITIAATPGELAALPADASLVPLARYARNGLFTGVYAGPGRDDLERDFARHLALIFERADTPRLSGVQMKAPMHLDEAGTLVAASGTSFTHILKPAGTNGFELLPVVEFLSLALGRAAGFDVPAVALAPMPGGMTPALVVERFDIREGSDDTRLVALEDMCSVLELPTEAKYEGTMERVAHAVRALSTAPEADMLALLRRALFAWLVADGDMHLKNMALLKTARPGAATFDSVRMAPLYDAVTTRVFPRLERDRMALKLNGKDDRLRRADFRAFAAIAGLRVADANAAIDDVVARLAGAVDGLTLPDVPGLGAEGRSMVGRIAAIVRSRIDALA